MTTMSCMFFQKDIVWGSPVFNLYYELTDDILNTERSPVVLLCYYFGLLGAFIEASQRQC